MRVKDIFLCMHVANISSLPVNIYIYIYVYMSVYVSQFVLIWSTAYPVYRFLLDPPEEVAEFPGLRFWRAIHSVTVVSAIEVPHWDAAVGRQTNTEGERYSPNQVCHAGAHHHHVNSLVHHDLIKTHNKSFSKPVSRFIYLFFHLGLL